MKNPSYEEVVNRTGHAEAVAVYYDPKIVSFKELVDVFFHHKILQHQSARTRQRFVLSFYCLTKNAAEKNNRRQN
jgi:peptide methionine sulfoxide reductase MsrA